MLDDELFIHDPVAHPEGPDRDVFASTGCNCPAPHGAKPLVAAKDAGAEVDDPPERKRMLPDVDHAFSGLPVPFEASLRPMSSKVL